MISMLFHLILQTLHSVQISCLCVQLTYLNCAKSLTCFVPPLCCKKNAGLRGRKMMIDHNELPPGLNEMPHDEAEFVQPSFYTQQPNLGHVPAGQHSSGLAIPVVVTLQLESHTLPDIGTTGAANGPTKSELRAGGGQNGEEQDEA